MTLYLVSNNMVLENIFYETDESVEEKRLNRPLSIEGEKAAVKLVKKIDADVIYSSNYASALSTAKYYASYKNTEIYIYWYSKKNNYNNIKFTKYKKAPILLKYQGFYIN